MKMAGLCWMAVVLAFSLSTGGSSALSEDELHRIIDLIRNKYFIKNKQFSVALDIPVDQKQQAEAFKDYSFDKINEKISKGEVYKGTNAVVATVLSKVTPKGIPYTEHAEACVLDNIGALAGKSDGNILLLYSYLSPCDYKCTNPDNKFNILDKINEYVPKWKNHAFVFTKVYDHYVETDKTIDVEQIKKSLKNLGQSKIGYDNIFRCYFGEKTKCIKCFKSSTDPEPVDQCVKND